MKKLLILLIVISVTSAHAQISNSELKRIRKKQSIEQINNLKNGVLLIRLKTKKRTISALRERGYDERADNVENELKKKNKEIVDAYYENFNFCTFYFFPSDYSSDIRNNSFDSVYFYNRNLTLDMSIRPKISTFFISEICPIESDTIKYYSGTSTVQGKKGLEKKENYYTPGTYGFEALIIRSNEFIQLAKPFPYYVRTWNSWRKPKNVVRKMNKKLTKYYKKVNK